MKLAPIWLALYSMAACTLAGAILVVVKAPLFGIPMIALWAWVAVALYAEQATGE